MASKISIIIPTLNEEKYIGKLLQDIYAQNYSAYDVIVVDGKSEDRTSSVVKKYDKVRLLLTKRQVAFQRHAGAKKARGDLLLFLDADTRLPPNFLEKVHTAFENDKIQIACPWYIPIEKTFSSVVLYGFFNSVFFLVQRLMPCGAGSCIIVRRQVYFQLGGFEEKYTHDDMQFLSKSKKIGGFRTLPMKLYVSSRRMNKCGFLFTLLLYFKLSWYFIRNDYVGANKIKYPFGIFSTHT